MLHSLSAGLMSTQESRRPEAEDSVYLCLKVQVVTTCSRLSKTIERAESSGVVLLLWKLFATCGETLCTLIKFAEGQGTEHGTRLNIEAR